MSNKQLFKCDTDNTNRTVTTVNCVWHIKILNEIKRHYSRFPFVIIWIVSFLLSPVTMTILHILSKVYVSVYGHGRGFFRDIPDSGLNWKKNTHFLCNEQWLWAHWSYITLTLTICMHYSDNWHGRFVDMQITYKCSINPTRHVLHT